MLGACRLREGSSPEGIDQIDYYPFSDLAGNVHMTRPLLSNNRDGVNFRQPTSAVE